MKPVSNIVVFLLLLGLVVANEENITVEKLEEQIDQLQSTLNLVSRQVMLQQFLNEEKIRSDGNSGIKQIRARNGGRKSYYSNTHGGTSYCSIHDHANNIRTVGMGEFIGVLNGVEFRTRHNDFRLNQPSTKIGDYHSVEPIPFPDVPPEVLAQPDVAGQIEEMREWFKAWKDSNHTKRDYRKYFKPSLCYLEGAWTNSDSKTIDEPFESDRHSIDASSWFDLQEKVRFTSYTGTKSSGENIAYLPTTIMKHVNGKPVFAQWNYRILCHPLKRHIPLSKFRQVEDLASRMAMKRNQAKHAKSRSAKFELDLDLNPQSKEFKAKPTKYNFLDTLMEEIPGKDNYKGYLTDPEGYDGAIYDFYGSKIKDVSRYHRWYRVKQKDAMGNQINHRGFSDIYMFAAKTTQDKIAGMSINLCSKRKVRVPNKRGKRVRKVCKKKNEKWSYAIPLEIIYMTPLNRWNPYDIKHQKSCKDIMNSEDKRIGEGLCKNMSMARKFSCDKFYYRTPDEFFAGKEINKDAADTSRRGGACMLNDKGNGVVTRASGTRIFLPKIPGVGILRQRFPIAPVHGQGNPIWKNLDALTDIVMFNNTYKFMKEGLDEKDDKEDMGTYTFYLGESRHQQLTPHVHYFTISSSDVKTLKEKAGSFIMVETEIREMHSHLLKVKYNRKKKFFYYSECQNKRLCFDRHPKKLLEE